MSGYDIFLIIPYQPSRFIPYRKTRREGQITGEEKK
jgi:hypothetical protein